MKNILFLLLLALITNLGALQAENPPTTKMDKVQPKEITVYKALEHGRSPEKINARNKMQKGLCYGDSSKVLLSLFGEPLKKKVNASVKEQKDSLTHRTIFPWIYHYKGAVFGTIGDKIAHFGLNSSEYYIHIGKYEDKICIGDNIESLRSYFPLSYKYKAPGHSADGNASMGSIALKVIDYGFLHFSYDAKTNKITEIILSPYY